MALLTSDTSIIIGNDMTRAKTYNVLRRNTPTQSGYALIYRAELSGNISTIAFPVSGITTNISDGLLEIGVMEVNSDGKPTNTFVTSAAVGVSQTGVVFAQLQTPYTVTQGNYFALVAKQKTGFDGHINTGIKSATNNNPYVRSYLSTYTSTTGLWGAITAYSGIGGMAYGIGNTYYGTSTYGFGATSLAIVSDTTEYGFSFQLNSNHPDIAVSVIKTAINHYNAGVDQDLKIYDSSGNLVSLFATVPTNPITALNVPLMAVNQTGSDVWLSAGQKYYILNGLTTTPGASANKPIFILSQDPTLNNSLLKSYSSNFASRTGGVITENSNYYCEFQLVVNKIRYNTSI